MLTKLYIEALLVVGSLPTRFGWLGIRGLLSELSIPWNREQTDSLTQVITEAGPRYQIIKAAPQKGVAFLFA